MTLTAFVSGHRFISPEDFRRYYLELIEDALRAKYRFVVGDCAGADSFAQATLAERGYNNVLVFHMFETPRINYGFETRGGFTTDDERDHAMTLASNYDIAWVAPGRTNSGTFRNLQRRARLFPMAAPVNR